MQTVKRLTIAIIGMTDTVTSEIRMAWFHAKIGLEGPYSASFIESKGALKFAAAIIDVRYEADVMLRLTDQLGRRGHSLSFFCAGDGYRQRAGTFCPLWTFGRHRKHCFRFDGARRGHRTLERGSYYAGTTRGPW